MDNISNLKKLIIKTGGIKTKIYKPIILNNDSITNFKLKLILILLILLKMNWVINIKYNNCITITINNWGAEYNVDILEDPSDSMIWLISTLTKNKNIV